MKILQSLSYYDPYISGVTQYCKVLAEKLVARGYESSVICGQHQATLPKQEMLNGVKVVRVPVLLKLSRGIIMPTWGLKVWQLMKRHDVVIVHLPQIEGILTALIAKLFRKPVIAVYHVELILPPGLANTIILAVVHVSSWLVFRLADRVVSYTEDYANSTKLVPQFTAKVVYSFPPMMLNTKKVTSAGVDFKYRDFIRIGYAGRISHEKGLQYLVEAVSLLQQKQRRPQYQIVIAGPKPVGEEEYFKQFEGLIEKNQELLQYLGPLAPLSEESIRNNERGTLVEFYQSIDIFVLPSINESFGIVQVEAMSFGKPAVVGDYPGMRVPIQKTGMGEVVPIAQPAAIAAAIEKIVADYPHYAGKISQVTELFKLENVINFYADLVAELTNTPPLPN